MTTIFARKAFLPEGWQDNVRLTLADGKIASVAKGVDARPGDHIVSTLLPALANLHSHSFQRAMAGMTERRGRGTDSFWTWRDLMYRFVQHLTPADIEAIAAFAFLEMQEAGFASVAEFHYVHHAAGGIAYHNRAELSAAIMSAAAATGIGLTLLPVLYTHAGLGNRPLAPEQLRFGNSLDGYLLLHGEASAVMARTLPDDCRMGAAPHSLRAAAAADIALLSQQMPALPLHIHVAEQVAEVEAVVAATGQRPVTWLLENVDVNSRWCLVHATHMTAAETIAMARTGAVAGLCPLTEASLGDGIFNGPDYLAAGGAFGVGTDSNIRISVSGELSMLEYSQRLQQRQRNVMTTADQSTGTSLYAGAAQGAAQALGRHCGTLAEGQWADLVALDGAHVHLCGLKPEQMLDGWIFASHDGLVTDLWSAGRHRVRQGRHLAHEEIEARYRQSIQRLMDVV